ncbi:helix-turn-helix domain-containing protein [Oscillospiraceae bacterium LTW-04]|nr:helix-turn-helix transcriptional regulator [Oscillospiraceae bacterium MB24-C1]
MNPHFPRVISLLRREQKLSQKQAAADLGISQALLSHYEKGIRECGLDFVVKVASYYNVSCDYLLGRSPDRSGALLNIEELPAPEDAGKENAVGNVGLLVMLNKKLISNSLYLLFDLLGKTKNRLLISQASAFFMLAVYRMFRIVYSTDTKNPQAFFSVPKPLSAGYADAAMRTFESNAEAIVSGELKQIPGLGEIDEVEPVTITTQSLNEGYPLFAASLFNLIKNAEEQLPGGKSEK